MGRISWKCDNDEAPTTRPSVLAFTAVDTKRMLLKIITRRLTSAIAKTVALLVAPTEDFSSPDE